MTQPNAHPAQRFALKKKIPAMAADITISLIRNYPRFIDPSVRKNRSDVPAEIIDSLRISK